MFQRDVSIQRVPTGLLPGLTAVSLQEATLGLPNGLLKLLHMGRHRTMGKKHRTETRELGGAQK